LRLEWNKYVKIRQGPQVRAGTFVVIVPSGIFGECDTVNKATARRWKARAEIFDVGTHRSRIVSLACTTGPWST